MDGNDAAMRGFVGLHVDAPPPARGVVDLAPGATSSLPASVTFR